MAVPKTKVSKQRKRMRSANAWKLGSAHVVECPQCHAMKAGHRVCAECGYYNGKLVKAPKVKAAE